MFSHICITIHVLSIILYSYIVNFILYRNEIKHQLYCIDKITKINMLFIKFMQWFSSQDMYKEVQDVIRNFADNVPYNIDDVNFSSLDKALSIAKKNNQQLIVNYDPINSGTIAIVYEGTLDNKPIIIKLLRHKIVEQLIESIELMKFIGYICQYIPHLQLFNVLDVVKLNEKSLLEQADFNKEITNMKNYKYKFEDNKDIIVPYAYTDLTDNTNDIIIMERIYGRKVQDLDDEELPNYCEVFNNLLVESLLKRHIIHSDLHIGNIFFLENNKLGLIDFGYVHYLDKYVGDKITLFYKFMFNRQVKKMSKLIIEKFVEYDIQPEINSEIFQRNKTFVLQGIEKAFNNDNILSGKKPININGITEINILMKRINGRLTNKFMNIILSLGPMCSIVSILKRNDNDNSLKYVFQNYVFKQVPDNLKNYN